ncbi:hypothetical protein CNYM01_07474 [Colletotrichum nymphaeae SA-01]|uniref:Carboxy-cis,cis-muconate cyclase n=1 Tax=Colletotrichum nymphaeae SA-01 TaxID=1460502 RepID=A0A135T8Z2_9PEZI|nr:hypothetical protein CNYM01_07474 [Colletotrichum nymphaeae SA-01]
MRFTSVIVTAAAASAAVIGRQDAPAASAKVIIGSTNTISVADYDGKSFNIVGSNTTEGTGPSWMAFKEPNLLYAVNENAFNLRLFTLDTTNNDLKLAAEATGAAGVVSIAFNKDKTRLVGASYTGGTVDVWDISDTSALKYMKNITLGGELGPNKERQTKSFAHQAILDPSGRYFAICDLGTDSISIIDSQDDNFEVVSRNSVSRAGCGPRHGAWYPQNGGTPTAFVAACELTNTLEVFSVSTTNGSSLSLTHTSELSTYGAAFPPANATTAAAGEIIISADGKHAYVSNRNSGNATDSISHFKITQQAAPGGSKCKPKAGGITLEFVDQISSGGISPRMFSFSKDEKTLFSTNVFTTTDGTGEGVLALSRAEDTGTLTAVPIASLPVTNFLSADVTMGPTFIQQIV